MRIRNTILLSMLIAMLTSFAFAQDFELTKHPGYIDLDQIEIPKGAGDVTEVTIGPELLQMFAAMGGGEGMPAEMGSLFSIRVKSFEIDAEMAESLRPVYEKIEKKLAKEGWISMVKVKKNGEESTNVSIKYDKNGQMQGLMVMSIDPYDEASFVNIVGKIDLKDLGFLGQHVSGSALDSLDNM